MTIGLPTIIGSVQDTIQCLGTNFTAGERNLPGCLANYGSACVGGLRLPEEGGTLAPWVAITFEGSGSTITVGNNSSPNTSPRNVAAIKSFEFGYSDGLTCRLVIHDEQGGSLVRFMEHILKDFACLKRGSPANVRMKVRFGWSKSGCTVPLPNASSRCYYCLCDSVETNFSEGMFSFEITGKDLCARMLEGSSNRVIGGTGAAAVPITQAIRTFMTTGAGPNVGSVRFCRMENGRCVEAVWREGGTAGPSGSWSCTGRDKLTVIRGWWSRHLSINGRSWRPQYNSEAPNGELIIWEDRRPNCRPEADTYWDQNCIGTFIVNGGKSSSVLEFNPKIRWDFARMDAVGGNLGSNRANPMGTEGSTNPGSACPPLGAQANPGAGMNVQTTTTETATDIGIGLGQQAVAMTEAARAMRILHDPIEADLVIVGDPTMLPPSEAMWAKNATVVLVNPYFITVGGSACGEWLSVPVCNEVLSSKGWICKSISHRIESGKYTTTIGLTLVAPGIDVPANMPLGGWTGGWTPVAC